MSIQGEAIHAASICQWPSLTRKVAWAIVLCVASGGIIPGRTTCYAQSPSEPTAATSEKVTEAAGRAKQITDPISGSDPNDPIEEKSESSRVTPAASWGAVPTEKVSLANLAPFLLPYFNNGPVFGLPGTEVGDFRRRTQLSGDWGGLRTDLARHGFFFDLYSVGAYQGVASGGLKTGGAFIQNTQLSINVDTGRAGLWSGGVFHVTLESRYGSFSPENTFTVGSTAPQYTGLTFPGPFFVHDVLPTEYFLAQALTPKFTCLLYTSDAADE